MSDDSRLSAEIDEESGIPIVRVHGEIDVYTVHEFSRALKQGVRRGGAVLIVDLSDISYLDSAGLSSLLAAYRDLAARGAQLYVVAPPGRPGVCRVLEITRLDTLINVRPTVDDVLREVHLAAAA